ncbi:MAG: hypothetical protein ABI683_07400 [Ginsengibacter sp.]
MSQNVFTEKVFYIGGQSAYTMEDFLSLFVSNNLAISFIKKTHKITLALFICNTVYAISQMLEWFTITQQIPQRTHSIPHYFYSYVVWPAITLADIVVIIVGSLLNYQSYAYLMKAIKNNDDQSLAVAFQKSYLAYTIFLASSICLLLNFFYRYFFMLK